MAQANQVDSLRENDIVNGPLTFGVNVQVCSEAERTDGDVGGDPHQEVFFEWFLRLFIEHEFIDMDEQGVRCL